MHGKEMFYTALIFLRVHKLSSKPTQKYLEEQLAFLEIAGFPSCPLVSGFFNGSVTLCPAEILLTFTVFDVGALKTSLSSAFQYSTF